MGGCRLHWMACVVSDDSIWPKCDALEKSTNESLSLNLLPYSEYQCLSKLFLPV